MRVRTAVLLAILALPTVAAGVERDVPKKFQGDWCTEPLPYAEDPGESDIRIDAHQIGYYRDAGDILAAAATRDQLALIVLLTADGRTSLATHEFELSVDGKQLTSLRPDGRLDTRIRCHAPSAAPPNRSFKSKLLRSST